MLFRSSPLSPFQKLVQYERIIQDRLVTYEKQLQKRIHSVAQVAKKEVQKAEVRPDEAPPKVPENIVLTPVQVSGVYKATSQNVISFYVSTAWPLMNSKDLAPIGPGWSVIGMTGVAGKVVVTGASNKEGVLQISEGNSESYLWSFTCQTDTEQNLQGVQGVIGAILYPPSSTTLTTNSTIGLLSGFYYVSNGRLVFYIKGSNPPIGFGAGWTVTGLPGLLSSNVTTVNYVPTPGTIAEQFPYDAYVTLESDKLEYNTITPVNCTATVKQPLNQAKTIGANVT